MTLNCEQIALKGNGILAKQVLQQVTSLGVREFCLCPGGRNAPLVYPLANSPDVQIYYWPEERSAAFFALGRIKATGKPAAVVTTSGTAAAEILPAAMEAHYSGLPLVLITADRPRRFRGTGAPQSAEQEGLFGCYAHQAYDLAEGEECRIKAWNRGGPLHLNVCFEEPNDAECQMIALDPIECAPPPIAIASEPDQRYLDFLQRSRFPFVVIGGLDPVQQESVASYLLHLGAPFYAESLSGIREDAKLEHLRMTRMEDVWHFSSSHGYPIDGILRIGRVPTVRLWRDLEHRYGTLAICSISDLPFSGLSCAGVIQTDISSFLHWAVTIDSPFSYPFSEWKKADTKRQQKVLALFEEEPRAEQSLVHALSRSIPQGSKIYLGNSLPIREWDQAATEQARGFKIAGSRGVNGIDGQISTFLGYSCPNQENWALLGDLTVLYDLAAPWITPQLALHSTSVVVVNNGGAGIFKRMFAHQAFQNTHNQSFRSFADFWSWDYKEWETIPSSISPFQGARLIELMPDPEATERFLKRFEDL